MHIYTNTNDNYLHLLANSVNYQKCFTTPVNHLHISTKSRNYFYIFTNIVTYLHRSPGLHGVHLDLIPSTHTPPSQTEPTERRSSTLENFSPLTQDDKVGWNELLSSDAERGMSDPKFISRCSFSVISRQLRVSFTIVLNITRRYPRQFIRRHKRRNIRVIDNERCHVLSRWLSIQIVSGNIVSFLAVRTALTRYSPCIPRKWRPQNGTQPLAPRTPYTAGSSVSTQ